MFVGGYELHLYCDTETGHGYREGEAQFSAETKAECIRQARRRGWVVRREDGGYHVRCPKHRKERG